jgi:hypothetical protein
MVLSFPSEQQRETGRLRGTNWPVSAFSRDFFQYPAEQEVDLEEWALALAMDVW